MGYLVLEVGQGSPSLLFIAHMDEIGYYVTNNTPDGFLRVEPAGGIPIRDSHSIEVIDMHDLDLMIEVVKGLIGDGAWRK